MKHLVLIPMALAGALHLGCKPSSADDGKADASKPPAAAPTPAPAAPAAPPAPVARPKPASTGKEMPVRTPKLTPEQARARAAAMVKAAKAADADCNQIAQELELALGVAVPETKDDAVAALLTMRRCAAKAKRWKLVLRASNLLLKVAPEQAEPDRIVRAHAELGDYETAIETAKQLGEKFPAEQAELLAAITAVHCRAEDWKKCIKMADASLKAFGKLGLDETTEPVLLSRIFRAGAWLVTGEQEQALADLDALVKANPKARTAADKLRGLATRGTRHGMFVDVVSSGELATGVYHLMGKEATGALVTLKLYEHTGKPRKLRVEAEVAGVTDRMSRSLDLAKRGSTKVLINPPLKIDFNAAAIRGPKPSQIALRVIETTSSGDRTILDETLPIEVLPRDYLVLKRKIGADSHKWTYDFLGAWITSNDPAIDAFLAAAKKRVASGRFVGEQDVTIPQVKALYEELKARGVSYVMDPSVFNETKHVQRTRLPAEVLATTNAQCVEGTLLFATLLEAIGLRPLIVVLPTHAFVGWLTVPKDGLDGKPVFLETTVIDNATFEDAVKYGNDRVDREDRAGAFTSKLAKIISVSQLRKHGFTAQPL